VFVKTIQSIIRPFPPILDRPNEGGRAGGKILSRVVAIEVACIAALEQATTVYTPAPLRLHALHTRPITFAK
jgi:hypothetical protein